MYKILLVTDRPEIAKAFDEVDAWETLGFRAPRVAGSFDMAVTTLKNHHEDGIAIALPADQEQALLAHLNQFYPLLPIFRAGRSKAEVVEALGELRALLNRTHADFSNDDFGEADMLQLCRHEYFRALLAGKLCGREDVIDHLRLLRSRMDPEKPCVVVDMKVPEGEDYFAGRWHYGAERLEIAMRNFFGAELCGMRMLVSVISSDTIRLLCCPMTGVTQDEENAGESLTGLVNRHCQEAMAQCETYLGLELHIVNIQVLPSVTALAQE